MLNTLEYEKTLLEQARSVLQNALQKRREERGLLTQVALCVARAKAERDALFFGDEHEQSSTGQKVGGREAEQDEDRSSLPQENEKTSTSTVFFPEENLRAAPSATGADADHQDVSASAISAKSNLSQEHPPSSAVSATSKSSSPTSSRATSPQRRPLPHDPLPHQPFDLLPPRIEYLRAVLSEKKEILGSKKKRLRFENVGVAKKLARKKKLQKGGLEFGQLQGQLNAFDAALRAERRKRCLELVACFPLHRIVSGDEEIVVLGETRDFGFPAGRSRCCLTALRAFPAGGVENS